MKAKILTFLLFITPVFLLAQNYEKEGDDLFAQGRYEAAYKKYSAFIAAVGESTSISQKQNKCTKCKNLLAQAESAEQKAQNVNSASDYDEASRLYNELYDIHPLQTYKTKANSMKQKADNIRANIQREQQAERERQAKAEKERQKQAQIERSQYYINDGEKLYHNGAYQRALESYNKAIETQGEYVTESLNQKRNTAKKCLQLYNQAKYAETRGQYDNAVKYYNDLYTIHSLAWYKNKVRELQQKAQVLAQKKQQQDERKRVELSINNAENTFTLQQLIEHPLGLADKDWDDSKFSTLKALTKQHPDFKNSPKDDAKYQQGYNSRGASYDRNDYIMSGQVEDVIVFAPLTYACMNYNDASSGSFISRNVEVTYEYSCSSEIYAEELVKKLKSEAQIYGANSRYSHNVSRATYKTNTSYSIDNLYITQNGSIVKIHYSVELNFTSLFY